MTETVNAKRRLFSRYSELHQAYSGLVANLNSLTSEHAENRALLGQKESNLQQIVEMLFLQLNGNAIGTPLPDITAFTCRFCTQKFHKNQLGYSLVCRCDLTLYHKKCLQKYIAQNFDTRCAFCRRGYGYKIYNSVELRGNITARKRTMETDASIAAANEQARKRSRAE